MTVEPAWEVITRLTAKDRCLNLFDAWRIAKADDEVEIRKGRTTDGDPAMMLTIGANSAHVFTAPEAERVIAVLANTVRQHPLGAHAEGLDTLLNGMRAGWVARYSAVTPTTPATGTWP